MKHAIVTHETLLTPRTIHHVNGVHMIPVRPLGKIFLDRCADVAVCSGDQNTLHGCITLSCVLRFISPVPPSTTPSCLNMEMIVPKKHLRSNIKLIFATYSPSSFALTGISSSSRPLICAQPVRPGRHHWLILIALSNQIVLIPRAGRGPITAMSPLRMLIICGSSSRLVLRKNVRSWWINWSGFSSI